MKLLSVFLSLYLVSSFNCLSNKTCEDLEKCEAENIELYWNITELNLELKEAKKQIQHHLETLELCQKPFGGVNKEPEVEKVWNIEEVRRIYAVDLKISECEKLLNALIEKNALHSDKVFSVALKLKSAQIDAIRGAHMLIPKVNYLKSKLPRNVQIIIWNKKVQLETKQFPNQYLYAFDDGASKSNRRHVFLWKAGGQHSQGDWEFTTKDDGKTFLIKNLHFNEYMYAAANDLARDSERRSVFTWRPGSYGDCEWKIEILNDDEVMLRSNKYHLEYLYGSYIVYDGERRHVFTWRPISGCKDTCVWKLRVKI